MKTLIITSNRDSFIKTVMFLCSMGFNFPSGETTEDHVAELHDYIRNRWDTE